MGLDLLRGVAALLVVVSHLPFQVGDTPALPSWITQITDYGQYGVHLFLVISGFCIHMTWARGLRRGAPRLPFLEFWKRRLRRLYPPYLAALVAAMIGLFVLARLARVPISGAASLFSYPSDRQLAVDLVLLLLLAQNLNGASARVGNGPFWSLALEEQLYLLYSPMLALRRRWGWGAALVVAFGTTLGWRAAYAWTRTPPGFWYEVGPARWAEWALGALAVEAHLGLVELPRVLRSPVLGVAALAAGIAAAPPGRPWLSDGSWVLNDLLFAFAAFVLLNAVCARETAGGFRGLPARALAAVGFMSYSLYLVHNPAMVVAKRIAVRAGLQSVPAIVGVRLLAAFAAAVLFFFFFERRFLNRRPAETRGLALDAFSTSR